MIKVPDGAAFANQEFQPEAMTRSIVAAGTPKRQSPCESSSTPLIAVTIVATVASTVQPVRSGARRAESSRRSPAAFNPMMGALMNMFVQPRHAKLGLAGRDGNWPLTGYELKELKKSLTKISAAIPRWKGLPVPDLFDAALTEPLAALEAAIKAGDQRQFGEAYGQLTAGCNACHATTDHPFIVLKVPDAVGISRPGVQAAVGTVTILWPRLRNSSVMRLCISVATVCTCAACAKTQWCARRPGTAKMSMISLRSRISGAPLRGAPRPGHVGPTAHSTFTPISLMTFPYFS